MVGTASRYMGCARQGSVDLGCAWHGFNRPKMCLYRPGVCLEWLVETWGVLGKASIDLGCAWHDFIDLRCVSIGFECTWHGYYRSGVCSNTACTDQGFVLGTASTDLGCARARLVETGLCLTLII